MKNYASKFPLPTGTIWARLPERVAALENPKLIKALISQTGANAPVPTILENNTGATLTFAYSNFGTYTITSDKPIFTSGKTGVTLGLGGKEMLSKATVNSTTLITIFSLTISEGTATNGLLSNNLLTIEIFN
jgi:hypothetical protein